MAELTSASETLSIQTKPDGGAKPLITDPSNQHGTLPVRPEGLADQYWDDKAGVKVDAVLADLTKLQTEAAARAAAVPEPPEKYEVALPADFQAPDGWNLDANDPVWNGARAFAHEARLSQEQFSDLTRAYVEVEASRSAAEGELLRTAIAVRDAALGATGAARVEGVRNWFGSVFDDKVAEQLSYTLFAPAVVTAFEKIRSDLDKLGFTGFRPDQRADTKEPEPVNLSPLERRSRQLAEMGG